MARTRQTELVHAGLDGAASPAQEQELRLWLAAHPGDQAEFDALRGFFDHLARVPKVDPPADLANEIVKNYTPREAHFRGAHKLFSWLRVSGISLPTNFWGEFQMSQQTPFALNRLVWHPVNVAFAEVAIVAFVFDIPPSVHVSVPIPPFHRYCPT